MGQNPASASGPQGNPLGEQPIGTLLLQYSLPTIISTLTGSLYNFVDQIFIGQRVGYLGNAATTVAYPLTILCGALCLLFSNGAGVQFNIFNGKQNRSEAMRYAGSGITLLALDGIILAILVRIFTPSLVLLFGATEEVVPYAQTYIGIIAVGIPFLTITQGGTLLIRSDGSPRYAMACSLAGVAVNFLLDYCEKKKINISLPSLRIDAFSLDVMSKVQDVRKVSLTFAPEAGTQRMRDVINKGLTQEDILGGARQAFDGGWSRVKLYFMIGLPTETDEDVTGISDLANKIAEEFYEIPKGSRPGNGRIDIVVSTSFFIPKPFTPFQWVPQADLAQLHHRQELLNRTIKESVNHKSIRYNWHDFELSHLEGIFARGDRRLSGVLVKAYEGGCLYDSWGDFLKVDVWKKAFEEAGIDPDFYTYRERPADEILPWDFIDAGVSKQFLRREYETAKAEKVTPNCRMRCSGCGCRIYESGVCYEDQNTVQ